MNPFSLLSLIPGLFQTINGVTNAIANERLKKIDAKTEEAKIEADENIKTLQAKRDVMIAESGSKINATIRAAFSIPVVFLMGKIYIWDKALGLGRTDGLDENLWNVIMVTIGFYFLNETITKTAKIIKA